MYRNIQKVGLCMVALGIQVQAQSPTATPDSGELLPAQSTALESALSNFAASLTAAPVFSTIQSEIATASGGVDFLGLAFGGPGGDEAEVSSILAEYPPDVSSWYVSVTRAEASIITSVLGTTALPTSALEELGDDTSTSMSGDMGTMTGMTMSTSGSPTGTGIGTGKTGSGSVTSTGTGKSSSTGTGTGTATKNAGPTLAAMNGVGCGIVAFGAAAACIGMI